MTAANHSTPTTATVSKSTSAMPSPEPTVADLVRIGALLPPTHQPLTPPSGPTFVPKTVTLGPTLISSTSALLADSYTPHDDATLYAAHPFLGYADEAWSARAPSRAYTGVAVGLYKFGSSDDADAVADRWVYQYRHYLEQMAAEYSNITIEDNPRAGFGRFTVLRYIHKSSMRYQETEYLTTVGPYVLNVVGAQLASLDGAVIQPAIDPAPAMNLLIDETLARMQAARVAG